MKSDPSIVPVVVILAPVCLFVGALLARVFPDGDSRALVDLFVSISGAFIGTAAGVWITLFADRARRAQELEDRHIASASVAQVTLSSMWSTLYNYEKQIARKQIADDQSPEPLWLRLKSTVSYRQALSFDVESLVFLLKTKDPEVLPELIVHGQRYLDVVRTFETLDVVRNRALGRMEENNIGAAGNPTRKELIAAIGPLGVSQLRTLTASLVMYLYRCMTDMSKFHERFQRVLRSELGEDSVRVFALEDFASELPMPVPDWIERAKTMCGR